MIDKDFNYPRPQLRRDDWNLLDGVWDFCFDENNEGINQKYYQGFIKQYDINVPFAYQTELSGINITKEINHVWYQKKINLSSVNAILHIEGSDYHTKVWVNGNLVGEDFGGYHRLSFDLNEHAIVGENLLVILVNDDYSVLKPRGKQRWKDENFGCWYTDTTGIYKSVWLEYVNDIFLKDIKITPDFDEKSVSMNFETSKPALKEVEVFYHDKLVDKKVTSQNEIKFYLKDEFHVWDLDSPELYDVKIRLIHDSKEVDNVYSYFGVRKLEIKNQRIYLNNHVLYQKLILDQGYFEKSGLTAPSPNELLQDILIMKEMGFNGARKHQKIEDERFFCFADVKGYLVWCEMPSMYLCNVQSQKTFKREWLLALKQLYNHPSIITWVPFNESWGIEEIKENKDIQIFVNNIYYETKAYDKMRFVITNDGWEHTISDILTLHHYEQDGDKLYKYFETIEKTTNGLYEQSNKGAFADSYKYQNQPIIFSEFGGTAFKDKTSGNNWGYGDGVKSKEEFIRRFKSLIENLYNLSYLSGYCYTQLSDVEQEVNGLVYPNREPKIDSKIIYDIISKKA